jgi:hypothetical protein
MGSQSYHRHTFTQHSERGPEPGRTKSGARCAACRVSKQLAGREGVHRSNTIQRPQLTGRSRCLPHHTILTRTFSRLAPRYCSRSTPRSPIATSFQNCVTCPTQKFLCVRQGCYLITTPPVRPCPNRGVSQSPRA